MTAIQLINVRPRYMLPPLLDFIPVQPAYCLRTSVQPVSKVNGGEPDGSELIKKRPSGATSYRNADREPDNASLKQLSGVFCEPVTSSMKMHAAICRRDRTWCYPKACTISLWRKAMLCRSMAWGRSRFIGSDSAVSKVRFIIDPVRGSILVQLFLITATYLMGNPHSPPCKGGVAAPLIKCCEATKAAQTGWSLTRDV